MNKTLEYKKVQKKAWLKLIRDKFLFSVVMVILFAALAAARAEEVLIFPLIGIVYFFFSALRVFLFGFNEKEELAFDLDFIKQRAEVPNNSKAFCLGNFRDKDNTDRGMLYICYDGEKKLTPSSEIYFAIGDIGEKDFYYERTMPLSEILEFEVFIDEKDQHNLKIQQLQNELNYVKEAERREIARVKRDASANRGGLSGMAGGVSSMSDRSVDSNAKKAKEEEDERLEQKVRQLYVNIFNEVTMLFSNVRKEAITVQDDFRLR